MAVILHLILHCSNEISNIENESRLTLIHKPLGLLKIQKSPKFIAEYQTEMASQSQPQQSHQRKLPL